MEIAWQALKKLLAQIGSETKFAPSHNPTFSIYSTH